MEPEVFYSEFFRVTHLTRKRMLHDQLTDLSDLAPYSVSENAVLYAQRFTLGIQAMQRRLWQIRGGE